MDYYVLVFQPSRGDENWRLVLPQDDVAGRGGAVAELVRQALRIDEDLAVELLARILEGRVNPEEPIHLHDRFLSADGDGAWLCVMGNEVGTAEPPLPTAAQGPVEVAAAP
ncbi:hypothetical protein [Streptacidiphilus sp. EB103A]|uniref:hypothetical protein n=1 Tax=Streptacidiphilus sp. EB103A TaxID=3156275 RepID=UPI003513C24B